MSSNARKKPYFTIFLFFILFVVVVGYLAYRFINTGLSFEELEHFNLNTQSTSDNQIAVLSLQKDKAETLENQSLQLEFDDGCIANTDSDSFDGEVSIYCGQVKVGDGMVQPRLFQKQLKEVNINTSSRIIVSRSNKSIERAEAECSRLFNTSPNRELLVESGVSPENSFLTKCLGVYTDIVTDNKANKEVEQQEG